MKPTAKRTVMTTLATTFALALSLFVATPAHAYSPDPFFGCPLSNLCSLAYSEGTITWFNRTANVTGHVVDIGDGYTQVSFRAFAGNTQIGSTQTRTADDENPSLGSDRGFNFTMGDTNLRGGIDSIGVDVCTTTGGNVTYCTGIHWEIRD